MSYTIAEVQYKIWRLGKWQIEKGYQVRQGNRVLSAWNTRQAAENQIKQLKKSKR